MSKYTTGHPWHTEYLHSNQRYNDVDDHTLATWTEMEEKEKRIKHKEKRNSGADKGMYRNNKGTKPVPRKEIPVPAIEKHHKIIHPERISMGDTVEIKACATNHIKRFKLDKYSLCENIQVLKKYCLSQTVGYRFRIKSMEYEIVSISRTV